MAATFGVITPFNLSDGDFSEYNERLEQYFVANKINDEAQKTAIFITVIGDETYSLLRSLLAPIKPNTKSSAELAKTLIDHLDPKPIVIAERYKFYERTQREDESISEFLAAIRKMSLTCEFDDFLEQALRDKLVCGISDVRIRKRLLVEKQLTLSKATEISKSLEGIEKEIKGMYSSSDVTCSGVKDEKTNQIRRRRTYKTKCYRCGDESHLANVCKFRNSVCDVCNMRGHVSRACRNKGKMDKGKMGKAVKSARPSFRSSTSSNNYMPNEEEENEASDIEEEIYHIHNVQGRTKPYLTDINVNGKIITFEIDTGAGVSIISEKTYKRFFNDTKLQPTNAKIKTYSNEPLCILGMLKVDVTISSRTHNQLTLYVIEGSGTDLVGRNWLSVIQLDWNKVLNVSSAKQMKIYNGAKVPATLHNSTQKKLSEILASHNSLFNDKIGRMKGYIATIHVKKDATPKFAKARAVPFALEETVTEELDRLEKEGILKSIPFSEWASPIVVIPKPDGSVRLCGDFKRSVNPNIETQTYPTPSNDEIFSKIQDGQKFSKVDLRQAYLQLELDEDAKKLMVINTHKGLKQYQTMPYGIKPASAIFQCHMENALKDVQMMAVRTDDVIISGKDDAEHLVNLEKLLSVLQELGITLKKEKCKFFMDEVEHLGLIISKNGLKVNPENIEAIQNAPAPKNIKELQSFIGGINYYSKFIPDMASICKPLYILLQKGVAWSWGQQQQDSFQLLKSKLTSAPVLALYDRNVKLKLDCDASNYGVGVVLSNVYPNGDEKPIAFASRTLNKNELNYSQLDKEAIAIIFGVKKFNQYLFGRHFVLSCDNKALCSIFGKKTDIPVLAASRLIRWSIILNAYDYEIEFRSTEKNANADMLSRIPLTETSPTSKDNYLYILQIAHMPITAEEIKQETLNDSDLKKVMECLRSNYWSKENKTKLQSYFLKRQELFIEDDILMWGLRVVIPQSLRKVILDDLHWQHPGIVRMKGLCRIHAWYPNIDKDVEKLVRECCQCKKVDNEPPKVTHHPWAWPSKPMDRIHLDYFGPYYGKVFLIMVDSYSKWCEVEIKKVTNAGSTINTLRSWFSKYGLPNQLVTDNGPQFACKEFNLFCKRNGIRHICSPPYHQSSNGQAERFVQIVKGLQMNDVDKGDVQSKLDNYLFSYRCTPSTVTWKTPAELFVGRKLRSRLDLIKPDIHYFENKFTEVTWREFSVNDKVFVRNYKSKVKWLPGTIAGRIGKYLYDVKVGDTVIRRHVNQIINNHTKQIVDDDYLTFDFSEPEPRPYSGFRRRIVRDPYPKRDRKPVNRYGIS